MRLTSSVQTAAVRSSPETQKTASVAKPAVETLVKKPTDSFIPRCPLPPLPPFIKQADAKVRGKQGDQLHAIAEGTRNGSVTAQESEKLLKEQQAIADATRKAMADGKLSFGEQLKLGMMQASAQAHIDEARGNSSRSPFAALDSNAQRQADQLDRLAKGRASGNITNSEAGELLGQQVEVADARGDADSAQERAALGGKLDNADKELSRHSAAGTQWDWKPLPHPLPFPRPVPTKPFPVVPLFRNATIAG
jgi:hypothetical protein